MQKAERQMEKINEVVYSEAVADSIPAKTDSKEKEIKSAAKITVNRESVTKVEDSLLRKRERQRM